MLEAERHRVIARLVRERSVVSISDMQEMLDASEATVRRDVNAMAEQGLLRRIRGGAESLTPRHEAHLAGMPFELSQEIGIAQKRAIARAAAQLIKEGDSIIINGGTTTYALVEFLADLRLDILTNSIPIVTKLLATSRNRVVLPGGTIFREQNIVLSPYESDDTIEHFWGQKLFTGCYGLNRFGVMETDPLIVRAQTRLLKRADELVVMADSRKLRQRSSMIVAPLDRISTLVTDDGAKDEELDLFRQAGIEVVVASAGNKADSQSAPRRARP
ncbi:MAG TPA: DeoR/GlpR family DNA-binding transcription regulator [Woeseiaceae bacterium]|nr:DeoR/GlpR family DNA-binding transcription regulator [Woeseiaceae bacterium]